jgi:glycosyltransferase involved in cell wall biosynthesis
MRILMLTQWFAPEPIFKGLPFAKELARRGHEVEVLTGFPNYPGGKVYEGYRVRFFQRENMDGIPVIRVPLYPDHGTSAVKRIANYGSFSLSAALLGALRVQPADVMYVYHPPATIGFPAALISWLRNIPIVYDIQDLWPDTLAATGMLGNKQILKMVGIWCSFVYRQASRIVVLSPGFKNALIERGIPSEKIELIYNWCDESQSPISNKYAEAEFAETLGLTKKFNVIFAGTMGKAQSLDAVLDAAALVAKKYPIIQFVFIGGGVEVERLKNRAVQENLANVKFLPRMPMSEIGAVLQLADVLLVHLKGDPLFRITIPSKTQAYLAAGKPILMGVDGDARDLVDLAGAGVSCSPENPDDIARAVIELFSLPLAEREDMGRRGSEFYRRELSIAAGVEKFEKVFQSVAQGKQAHFV